MTLLRQMLQAHRRSATLFLVLVPLAWAFAVTVWVYYDERGEVALLAWQLLMTLPIIAGALLGWWRRGAPDGWLGPSMLAGALAGLVTISASFLVVQLLTDTIQAWVLRRPALSPGESVLGYWRSFALGLIAVYTLFGIVRGALGAIAGWLLAAAVERVATR